MKWPSIRWPWAFDCDKGRHDWRQEYVEKTQPTGHVWTQVWLHCRRCPARHYQGTVAGAPPEAAGGRPPPTAWRGKRPVPREPVFRPRSKGN